LGLTKLGEAFEGDDPIGRWVAELREAWADVRFESERTFEGKDVVVSFYRAVRVGRRRGAEVVATRAAVYRIRDGKTASERVYLNLDDALEAAGLRE
jgi:ketosteroid isomerase-like protein